MKIVMEFDDYSLTLRNSENFRIRLFFNSGENLHTRGSLPDGFLIPFQNLIKRMKLEHFIF